MIIYLFYSKGNKHYQVFNQKWTEKKVKILTKKLDMGYKHKLMRETEVSKQNLKMITISIEIKKNHSSKLYINH